MFFIKVKVIKLEYSIVTVERKAYDNRTPRLLKVEWAGYALVGFCSKFYCRLVKQHIYVFLDVLTNRASGGGKNRGFRVNHSSVEMFRNVAVPLNRMRD